MVTDEQLALWAAIRANPDDDTPRLVYADWLQEHDHELRAEFIRVQSELARLIASRPPGKRPPEEGALSARCEQLLAPNRKAWTEAFVRVARPDVDRRDRDAVKELRVWWSSLPYRRGFLSPRLRTVEVERIAAAPLEPLDSLTVFEQSDGSGARSLSTLVTSPFAPCVYGITRFGTRDNEAAALATGYLPRLDTLTLSHGPLTSAGATAVANWSSLGRVRALDLNTNRIGDDGAAALARSPHVAAVTNLHLAHNGITDAGAITLADSPHLGRVLWITLNNNPIGPVGWRRLRERFGGALGGAPELV